MLFPSEMNIQEKVWVQFPKRQIVQYYTKALQPECPGGHVPGFHLSSMAMEYVLLFSTHGSNISYYLITIT